jgi:hypothetical protein
MWIGIQKVVAKIAGMIDNRFDDQTLIHFRVVCTVVSAQLHFRKTLCAVSRSQEDIRSDHLQ